MRTLYSVFFAQLFVSEKPIEMMAYENLIFSCLFAVKLLRNEDYYE